MSYRSKIEDKYGDLFSADAASAIQQSRLNKLLSESSIMRQAKTMTGLTRLITASGGSPYINSMLGSGAAGAIAQDAVGINLALGGTSNASSNALKQQAAEARNKANKAGQGTGFGDIKAAAGNSASSISSMSRNAYMAQLALGMSPTSGLSSMMSPGMLASSMSGGIGGLGSNILSAAGVAGGGMLNPMMGMGGLLAATKAGKAAYNWTQENSSSNNFKAAKYTKTNTTTPNAIEAEYGNNSRSMFATKIGQLMMNRQMSPAEALLAEVLTMIEMHTSVLPLIAAKTNDAQSIKDKEGGNNAQNIVESMFGDGSIRSTSLQETRRSVLERLFTGLEKGTSTLNAATDPFSQLSTILSGKSVTKQYNEFNDKSKEKDQLRAEKKFAQTFGVGLSLVQAIHTSPSQMLSKAETYEAKVISMLSLQSEISRFSAHELLKIRTDGFGLKNTSSHGYLEDERDRNAIEDEADVGLYDQLGLRFIDEELLGRIPGLAGLSNLIKGISAGNTWMNDMFLGDDNGDGTRKQNRGLFQVFSDWMSEDLYNPILGDESALRDAVDATELGPNELMAKYMGVEFPDRFELLLKYNLSQTESLSAMAGPIRRSRFQALSMNKYTGALADESYHKQIDQDIKQNMREQLNTLNPSMSLFGQIFTNKNRSQILRTQKANARESNPFLDNFLSGGMGVGGVGGSMSKITHAREQVSVQDLQDQREAEEYKDHAMSIQEKQLAVLQEIRDGGGTGANGANGSNGQKGRDYLNEGGSSSIVGDMYGLPGMGGRAAPVARAAAKNAGFLKKLKFMFSMKGLKYALKGGKLIKNFIGLVSMVPFLGPLMVNPVVLGGLATAAALYGGYKLVTYVKDKFWGESKSEKEAKENMSVEMKQKVQKGVNSLTYMEKVYGDNTDAAAKVLANTHSIDDLKGMMLVNTGNGFNMSVIAKAMKIKGAKFDAHQRADKLITNNPMFDPVWNEGAKDIFDQSTFKEQLAIKRELIENGSWEEGGTAIRDIRRTINQHTVATTRSQQTKLNQSNAGRKTAREGRRTSGYMQQDYINGVKRKKPHHGIDWAADPDTPVVSIGYGIVKLQPLLAGSKEPGGNILVVEDHKNRVRVLYMHLNSFAVAENSLVVPGDVIAYSGATSGNGHISGPHIHISVKSMDTKQWMNPDPYITKMKHANPDDYDDFNGDGIISKLEKEAINSLKPSVSAKVVNQHHKPYVKNGKLIPLVHTKKPLTGEALIKANAELDAERVAHARKEQQTLLVNLNRDGSYSKKDIEVMQRVRDHESEHLTKAQLQKLDKQTYFLSIIADNLDKHPDWSINTIADSVSGKPKTVEQNKDNRV